MLCISTELVFAKLLPVALTSPPPTYQSRTWVTVRKTRTRAIRRQGDGKTHGGRSRSTRYPRVCLMSSTKTSRSHTPSLGNTMASKSHVPASLPFSQCLALSLNSCRCQKYNVVSATQFSRCISHCRVVEHLSLHREGRERRFFDKMVRRQRRQTAGDTNTGETKFSKGSTEGGETRLVQRRDAGEIARLMSIPPDPLSQRSRVMTA